MYEFVDRPIGHLGDGSRFILWAMRAWTDALAKGACPPGALATGFLRAGGIDALPSVHRLLGILNAKGLGTLGLSPLRCGRIGDEEAVLLILWRDALQEPLRARALLELLVHADAVEPALEALLVAGERLCAAGLAPNGLATASASGRG